MNQTEKCFTRNFSTLIKPAPISSKILNYIFNFLNCELSPGHNLKAAFNSSEVSSARPKRSSWDSVSSPIKCIRQYFRIFSNILIFTIRILSTDFRNLLSWHRVGLTWRCFELKYRKCIQSESLGNFNETFSMFARGLVKGN